MLKCVYTDVRAQTRWLVQNSRRLGYRREEWTPRTGGGGGGEEGGVVKYLWVSDIKWSELRLGKDGWLKSGWRLIIMSICGRGSSNLCD